MQTINDISSPLVGILRGLPPADAVATATTLFRAGMKILEVPLNRPNALQSIQNLADMHMQGVLVGGGTMLSVDDVDAVYAAGGRLFVAPNCNPRVIRHAVDLGMLCAPGVVTPTEAFVALDCGAQILKIFPAATVGLDGLKAFKSVLPAGTALWPVGGVTPENMAEWVRAGATGFGIGSNLYQPGIDPETLSSKALSFLDQWKASN